jgi:hypothetical protein
VDKTALKLVMESQGFTLRMVMKYGYPHWHQMAWVLENVLEKFYQRNSDI